MYPIDAKWRLFRIIQKTLAEKESKMGGRGAMSMHGKQSAESMAKYDTNSYNINFDEGLGTGDRRTLDVDNYDKVEAIDNRIDNYFRGKLRDIFEEYGYEVVINRSSQSEAMYITIQHSNDYNDALTVRIADHVNNSSDKEYYWYNYKDLNELMRQVHKDLKAKYLHIKEL